MKILNESEQSQNDKKKLLRVMFLIIFGVLFYMFVSQKAYIQWAYNIIKPILQAFIIAYLLNPLVKILCKKFKIKKGISIIIIIALLIAILFFVLYIMIPNLVSSFVSLTENLPTVEQISNSIDHFLDTYVDKRIADLVKENSNNLLTMTLEKSKVFLTDFLQNFIDKTLSITTSIISLLISLIIAIYMLLDKEDLTARIKRFIYAYNKKETADYILNIGKKSNEAFLSYINGKFIDSLIIGILCFILFSIARIPYASILALIIGITNMIEYFGPFIGAVPAILITLFTNPSKVIWVGILIFALQQFDGLYLGPKIVGKKVGARAFWIIIAVTIGGAILGVPGMVLGVPSMVLIKNLVEQSVDKRLKKKGMSKFEIDKLK